MFKKIFALALLLVFAALCARKPPPDPAPAALPNTCARAPFDAAVARFDSISAKRAEALARLEAAPVDEPAEYVRRWNAEQAALQELAKAAVAVDPPRCLANAKALFLQHLAQTATALDLRSPDKDFIDYRRARETSETIHGQYAAEVKLQEKNRQ